VIDRFRKRAVIVCTLLSGSYLAQRNPSVTVPIHIAAGLVYMQGAEGGSGPLSVVLDTGSSLTVFSPSVARDAGLKSTQNKEAAGMGQGTNETLRLFDDCDLRWGNPADRLQLLHQKCAALPIDYISEEVGERTDAIFGSNLFLHHKITIDYESDLAVFTPDNAETPSQGTPIPIHIFGNVPFAEAEVRGEDGKDVKGLFFVDSGTTGGMLLNRKFLDQHPNMIASAHFVDTPTVRAVGGEIRIKRVRVPQIRVGSFVFDHVVAAVPDTSVGVLASESVAGIIGAGILKRFTVTWDYAHQRMFLLPNKTVKYPFETDSSGLHLVSSGPDYHAIIVDGVLPGSPAALAGVRQGDQIMAVDGAEHLPLWKVSKMLCKAGTPLTLTLLRKASELQVKVLLRSPFPTAE